jgi:hypothetical protein
MSLGTWQFRSESPSNVQVRDDILSAHDDGSPNDSRSILLDRQEKGLADPGPKQPSKPICAEWKN